MVCFYPRRAPMIGGPEHIGYLPCGQCLACTINKRRIWTARQLIESDGKQTWFITLTYNDENLPPEVQKEEVQRFMKRLRKNSGQKFRYFACAEYGDKYGRPHFHLNLFGFVPSLFTKWVRNKQGSMVEILQCKHINTGWQGRGYHTIDQFTDQRAAYVANYVTKKIKPNADETDKQPEFALMSRMPGIGAENFLKFCTTNAFTKYLVNNPEIAEVPRVYARAGKYWPVGSYLREYVHQHTGIPKTAEIPVQLFAGQEKLKSNYENPEKADLKAQVMARAVKTRMELKRHTAHV